ncbi:group II intron reverse transcriptase/maturase [Caedibacter taeniospiralis]|uniref:group II intron reverse transcriptase/maturase n=1 Tax=Caedibacter taeniospiralis TaxID=28907 RepID=UPI000C26E6CE|nr:group II intron reverse transcriptase/maturase [Caedibacter taeniospiralis]
MSNAELNKTLLKLSSIAECARGNRSFEFTSLAHLLDAEFLSYCYYGLDRNKAVGIDKVSWQEYGVDVADKIENLVMRLKRKTFKPMPSRRVYIPKGNGESRPLGISAIENKIVESGIMLILQSIYEQDFLECSYGFRPGRNTHQALNEVDKAIMTQPVNHLVEADIKGFFDNVSHEKLKDFVKIRVKDTSLLHLIDCFLRAGYIDKGVLIDTEKGTPQGSILSPMLANIFLHYVLDKWFEDTVKQHVEGFCRLVRYADDFVCLIQYQEDARKIERALANRFNKHELQLHPEKSRNISFGRFEKLNALNAGRKANTFDFLGFTHFCDKTRKGYFKLGRKTSAKKFRAKCKDLNLWLKSIRNVLPTKEWWKILKAKLRGHFEYYGVSGNYPSIAKYYSIAMRQTLKWLNRRSQKRKMNWWDFNKYVERHPLPRPRINHIFYTLVAL